jgi:hypothetical protein
MWVILTVAAEELEPLVLLRDMKDTSVGAIRTPWPVLQHLVPSVHLVMGVMGVQMSSAPVLQSFNQSGASMSR